MLLFIFRKVFERDGAELPSECKNPTKRKKSTPATTTTTSTKTKKVRQKDKQKRGNLATDKHAASSFSSPPFRHKHNKNPDIELKEYPARSER